MLVALHNFCANDLSAFYFDIRKDSLYCDTATSNRRRAARTVMSKAFDCLVTWLAPVLCFTAEEAYLARPPSEEGSVHLLSYPVVPTSWEDKALDEKWEKIRDLRRVVTGAMELARADKKIGSSLAAAPEVYLTPEQDALLKGLDFAEICIASHVALHEATPPQGAFALPDVKGIGVVMALAEGKKCERCWQILPEVGKAHPDLCCRCAEAVK
jgi:isoleucyl-tRNA synthetase